MFNPFKRKRKLMVTVEVEDRSKDKEAVFVRLNGMRIAFPAHSAWKVQELIDELAYGLGFTAEVIKDDNSKIIEIRRS